MLQTYGKSSLILILLYLAGVLFPNHTIDPWGVVNIRKILQLIFALSFIQILGDVLFRYLGAKIGSTLLGFFGGLVSSTAFTVSLAKETKDLSVETTRTASIAFLSATLAMLMEAFFLVYYGLPEFSPRLLIFFAGPLGMTLGLILWSYRRSAEAPILHDEDGKIDFRSVLKLAGFIFGALSLSKLFEQWIGIKSLLPLTFVVSLFEIHGSVIANVQLHEAGVVDPLLLVDLLATSFFASFTSKLF